MYTSRHDTAVVVLSYNGKLLHQDFFPLLIAESEGLYDVILVDNASTDHTAAYVREHFPQVSIITIPINRGFANGYYEALLQIQAEYYVMLSADFEVTQGWFQPMHLLMQQHQDIAALQPKIKYYKQKNLFEYAGAGGGFIDKWGYLFCRGRIFFTIEEDKGQYDDHIEIFWAGGGCMFLRASAYHQAGGLDRDLYAHMEEVDLCWRFHLLGYRVAYCGSSTVYHIGGSVISYGSPQKLFYNYRNSLVLLYKNLPTSKLIWLFPWRLILDGISGIRLILKGEWVEVWTIIKAHFSFYGQLGLWTQKRKQSRKLAKKDQSISSIYQASIIHDYFIKGKKYFTELDTRFVKKL